MTRRLWFAAGVAAASLLAVPPADAAVLRGLTSILSGIFRLPFAVLGGTLNGPPVLGTLMGAVNGIFGSLGLIGSGAAELGMSAVSVAKSAAPFLLPFLL
jgi:hypothetical protein